MPKSATWLELKTALRDYEKPELLRLLQELYKLNHIYYNEYPAE